MAGLVTALRDLLVADEQAQQTALQNVLLAALQRVLLFVLSSLSFVQDLLLSWGPFQRALLFAFRSKHGAILQRALLQPAPNASSFDQLEYYVDANARQLLQFAALAAVSTHLQSGEVLAPAQLLPQVSRVLLQTEEPQPKKYLEAIAAALAGQMQASLLFVDAMLLASLAGATFGAPPEAYLGAFSGTRGSTGGLGHAAPKLQFAWLALREVLFASERPTVVYIRNAEQLLAGSYDAYHAFIDTFGKTGLEAALEGTASHAPLVLLGGITVNESAAALAGVRPQRQRQAGSEGGEEVGDDDDAYRPRSSGRGAGGLVGGSGGLFDGGPLGGLDDEFGLSDLSDLLFGLSKLAGETQRPNARKLLAKIFLTRVKLQAPPAGPAAVRHGQRLQRDAAEEAEEDNYRAASAVAASTGVTIPPKSSGIYLAAAAKPLAREDWERVLSWAVAMQTLRAKQDEMEEERRLEQAAEAEQLAAAAAVSQAPGEIAPEGEAVGGGPATPAQTGLRRRRGGSGDSGGAAGDEATQPRSSRATEAQAAATAVATAALSLAAGALRAANPLHLAAAVVRLPWQVLSAAGGVARWGLYRLPLVGEHLEDWMEGTPSSEQLEAELQELEAQLAELDHGSAEAGSNGGGAGGSGDSTLRLSELAVQYGLSMLARSSGSTKAAIQPANQYERQLLDEVLAPEDCGRGFSEVGALSEAKNTLREAVQLPLKHPELFTGGALARPSKGVLLFGPPGTGKTLVARAAAAECGAAFLAINPSALASKWFGDSLKFTRAAFSLAAKLAPCVLFIDEVDSLLGRRNSQKEHEAMREMRNEFMAQWDGIRPGRERVMVLGATNRPFDLDEAVLRRFTHRMFIGLPDRTARQSILEVVLEGESLAVDLDLSRVAELTEGYSGSDLKQLCVQAAMRPVRAFLEHDSATAAAAEAAAAVAQEDAAARAATTAAAAAEDVQAESGQGEGGASDKLPLPAVPEGDGDTAMPAAAPIGLPLVPRLDSLLRQAERIASRPTNPRTDLRPISMRDFEEAIKEVGPSVDPESSTIQELKEWANQFGTSSSKQGLQSRRLSYFT